MRSRWYCNTHHINIRCKQHVAIELLEPSDWLSEQGGALLDLAEVLDLGGLEQEALAATEEALALLERKQNTVAAERARVFLGRTQGGAPTGSPLLR